MSDFFCGWRRKTGCITLLMALAFGGLHVRSMTVIHGSRFGFPERIVFGDNRIQSIHGKLEWYDDGHIETSIFPVSDGRVAISESQHPLLEVWYWPLIIPLTLLSTYLILRPGKRNLGPR